MQTISHNKNNIHPIFDDIERFYAFTSVKNAPKTLVTMRVDKSFEDLYQLFTSFTDGVYPVEFVDRQYKKLELPKYDSKSLILCFSGGKDSIAAVKHYQKLGYNIYLYHLRHINPPLWDEYIHAEEIARHLNLPIYIDEIKLSGHHDWVEHPMKNIIIANMALQYGIREGIGTKIAFGNYYSSSVLYDNFEFCGGDDIETWVAYEKIIRRIIPGFKMYVALKNLNTTLKLVCNDKELLDMSVSCLGRASLRLSHHDWVKNKYGIHLPKNRCGRCYKCCVEYIYMADHGLQDYSPDYYEYCFNNLRKNAKREDGVSYISDDEVWNRYFFYDKSKSTYFRKGVYK